MAYFKCGGGSDVNAELLWTNPSPTASFAAQTVSLDLSGYEAVPIRAKGYVASDGLNNHACYSEKGLTTHICVADSGKNIRSRDVTVNDNGITFTAPSTLHCIPIYIYGLKTSLNIANYD